MPQRIQRKRSRGWRMPEGAVYVGRPAKWGNPFRAGQISWTPRYLNPGWVELDTAPGLVVYPFDEPTWRAEHPVHSVLVPDVKTAVRWFRVTRTAEQKREIRAELADKDLCCWCRLEDECHADVLLEIANSEPQP